MDQRLQYVLLAYEKLVRVLDIANGIFLFGHFFGYEHLQCGWLF